MASSVCTSLVALLTTNLSLQLEKNKLSFFKAIYLLQLKQCLYTYVFETFAPYIYQRHSAAASSTLRKILACSLLAYNHVGKNYETIFYD